MRFQRIFAAVFALLGLVTSANAATYVYVGSWEVDQLSWHDSSDGYAHLPYAFTGQEAAAYLFGGSAANYVISTNGSDATQINFSNWVTSWGCSLCTPGYTGTIVAEDFAIGTSDPNYSPSNTGTIGGGPYYAAYNGTSALLQDWPLGPYYTNYAFMVVGVPEPSTWAMLMLGFAGIGLMFHRRRGRVFAA
ncbi:PEP-CTERM sorting domain-containing protein [Bradyrhizobium sp. WYCCWR 13023]|uniref:PEP-CTERM sorting domain-containing protein n=1 Tax=Bradyrhizobium zhengyangense TaxID=2911009 RepID=A0A9X1RKC7_9BRAD|nr:PEP-CTERM sorting domain-containing protein [Bradyrhizobium zhengyangense]MCG2633003.1 PEP-CTERM sorting domain-containing protein [Bradyrhizobium zhengyangense]